ncbi:hypothetical protein [Bdellovibrio sp. KM01]|uniref:hypothetical protein n=1 Tax=Bdellovibrio sp. KM01 TaxID=2748865 RepID=UPI001C66D612|nr:hypothetical protein [Bdellovibrio sp. KM01]
MNQFKIFLYLICFIPFGYFIIRYNKIKKNLFEVEDFILLGTAILFVGASSGMTLHLWDEFSHWGLVETFIKTYHAIPKDGNIVNFPSYYMGMSLWIDFLSWPGSINQSEWYAASLIISLIPIWIFLKVLKIDSHLSKKEQIISCFTVLLTFIALIHITKQNLFALYVDINMASFLCLGFIAYTVKDYRTSLALLLMQSILLVVSKHIGVVFAFTAILGWVVYRYKDNVWKNILGAVIVGSITLSTKIFWDYRLRALDIRKNFDDNNISVGAFVKRFLTFNLTPHETVILKNFVLSTIGSQPFLILLALTLLYVFSRKRDLSKTLITTALLTLAAYLGILYLTYSFLFGSQEAEALASFDRYIFPIFTAWILFFVAKIFILSTKPAKYFSLVSEKHFYFKTLSLALITLIILSKERSAAIVDSENIKPIRATAKSVIESLPQGKNKVFLLWQHSNGFEFYILRNELLPNWIQTEPFWAIAKEVKPQDYWTRKILSNDEIYKSLSGFNYLLLKGSDEQFWNEFGEMFDAKTDGIFALETELGRIRFILKTKL